MTAEIEFEQQFEDVARTRAALQRCEKQLGQIPKVLKELCTLFKECTMSLDQVVTTSAISPSVTSKWNNAKSRYLAFADGDALTTFTTYFQQEVVNRLDTLAARAESAYVVGKERREAREKFLKNTGKKVDPGKVQKKKDVFSLTDQDFGLLYNRLNTSRANVAGPVARSFFLGYSSVTFAIANALCATDEVITPETLAQESRRAARVERVTAVEERGFRPGPRASPSPIVTPTKPAAAAAHSPQRRLSNSNVAVVNSSDSGAGGAGGAVGAVEGLSARQARQAATGIPIYYNDARNQRMGSVTDALPTVDSVEGDEPNQPETTGLVNLAASALQSHMTVVGAPSGAGPRARRSTAPVAAHFNGIGDGTDTDVVEHAGATPRQLRLDGGMDSPYHDFFDTYLRPDD